MPPLCKELYAKLTEKLGKVKISSEGHSFQSRMRKIGHEMRMEIISPGEYYCVDCPFCNDRRQRLWINHRFAEYRWLAVCYNETRCMDGPFGKVNRRELYNIIFNGASKVFLPVSSGIEREPSKPLDSVPFPGDISFIDELPEDSPVRRYLEIRGYDPTELALLYDIGLCTKVNDRSHYPLVNRLFIPISMNSKMVGWQGRYIGELDWKTVRTQKYFNMRGMSKKDMLYNFDNAKNKDLVVVTEGVADVWRVGPCAVALLGSDMSGQQKDLIRHTWQDKPVVIFLDSDAQSKAVQMVASLRPYFDNLVFNLNPNGKDPGSMSREEIWQLIDFELKSRHISFSSETTTGVSV